VNAIGIDIGGTSVKAGLVTAWGEILEQFSEPTPTDRDGFARLFRRALTLWPDAGGVGFACKGRVDPVTTEIVRLPGTLQFLEGARLAELAGGPGKAAADNDARAAMLGEVLWGAARGLSDALMLTLGTGVGGAILANGVLLRGATGIAGHMGHVTIEPDGHLCICGNRGCLETVFSSKAIESEAMRAVHSGCVTRLAESPVSCVALFRLAAEGDAIARDIRDRAIRRLGAAIAGLLFVFDPEAVILGGHITDAGETLLLPLQAEIDERTRSYLERHVPLRPTASRDPSGIAGAAALVLNAAG
jgi:glucokinase